MSTKSQTLKNNVLLITEPVAEAKTASIGFWFTAGSRFEDKTQHGIAHFTEHMLFKGTVKRTTHDISCAFDRIGGYANAFTEREEVCIYCTVPATDAAVEQSGEIFCDMATNALFDKVELEKERTVIENEIAAIEDDPDEMASDAVAQSVWPEHEISRCIGGTIQDVEAITREALLSWYDKMIVHGELVVCAAGRFDEQKLAVLLEKLPLHKQTLSYPAEQHFSNHPVWKPGCSFIKAPFKQEQYFALYQYRYPISLKEYFTLAVFNAAAGDTMSSRLFETLREENGFCYTVYSFFTFYEDACVWCAYASSDKKKAKEVTGLLCNEIEKLETQPFTEEEIEAAKEHLCGEEIMSAEEMEYVSKRLARNFQMGFPFLNTEEVLDTIRTVTKEDIIQVVHCLMEQKGKSAPSGAFVSYGPALPHAVKKEIVCRIK